MNRIKIDSETMFFPEKFDNDTNMACYYGNELMNYKNINTIKYCIGTKNVGCLNIIIIIY